MKTVSINKQVPNFTVDSTEGNPISLADLAGKIVVLYFYPKDSTPGCTQEGLDFNANLAKFKRQNAVVLGISRDSLKQHENFRTKQSFKFHLLSDVDEKLCVLFDVIKMKNMYGKQIRGIERSTFLLDSEGVLRKEWRKVKVKGHVDDVLEAVKNIA